MVEFMCIWDSVRKRCGGFVDVRGAVGGVPPLYVRGGSEVACFSFCFLGLVGFSRWFLMWFDTVLLLVCYCSA
jgi:hypothetical protein